MLDIVNSILNEIGELSQKKKYLLVAIDGRCAAGKTTLAAHLQKICKCNVIHMDHFFLRTNQRIAERLSEPGGNVDYERFLKEIILPLRQREAFSYRPYDCHMDDMSDIIQIEPLDVNIIEGAYCCHPTLYENYDLKIFLTVDKVEQLRRIIHRNGIMNATQFEEKWIPLEEYYFTAYNVKERCDLCFQTDSVY